LTHPIALAIVPTSTTENTAMPIKAKRENGLWVITAIVGSNVEEFAGFRLRQAIELFYRAQARA